MIPAELFGGLGAISIGIAILLALRIAYGTRSPGNDPVYLSLRVVGWTVFGIGWGGFLVAIGGFIGIVLWLASVVIALMIAREHRILRARAHLALISLAIEKQMPLPPCVEAYAAEQGGLFSRRALAFAADLRSGMPVPQAIAASSRVFPSMAELAARVGAASNNLAHALRDELVSHSGYEPIRRSLAARMLYFVVAFAMLPMVGSFIIIKIVPAMIGIFNDFEINLPSLTVVMIQICTHPLVKLGAAIFMPLGLLLVLLVSIWYSGVPILPIPGLRGLMRRFDRATIQRALAFPAERSQPLEPMMALLARYYPARSVRRRMQKVSSRIAGGQDWIGSLRSQSLLGKADAGVLSAAQKVGNLPWALREMADSNERRLIHRLEFLVQLASIAMVLIMGSIVGAIVIAFFIPLVKLIQSLT